MRNEIKITVYVKGIDMIDMIEIKINTFLYMSNQFKKLINGKSIRISKNNYLG